MRIEVAGTITIDDMGLAAEIAASVRRPAPASGNKKGRKFFVWLLLLLFLAGALLLQVAISNNPDLSFQSILDFLSRLVGLTLLAVLMLLNCLYFLAVIYMRRLRTAVVRLYEQNRDSCEQVLVFDEIGFVRKTKKGETTVYSWNDFYDWHLHAAQIVLFESKVKGGELKRRHPTPSPIVYQLFPRHLFTEAQYQELREFLARHFSALPATKMSIHLLAPAAPSEGILRADAWVKPASSEIQKKPDESP